MKTIQLAFLVLFAFPSFVQAKPFAEMCPNINTCIKVVSQLTQETYLSSKENLKCEYSATDNLELNAENADLLLSGILNQCGLSRVPFGAPKMYRIERTNEAKGMNVPSYPCSYDVAPNIPNTWDIVRMEYKMAHPESVKHLENLVRTYANMGARIYGYEADGTLVITETGIALKELYAFIKARDVKISETQLKQWSDYEQRRHELQMKNNKPSDTPEKARQKK
jgi:hypothetical protein